MSIAPSQSKKIEQTPKPIKSSNDVHTVLQESLGTYFKELRENTAIYLQATSDLQEEIIQARKNNANTIISIQKAAFEKLGGENIPSGLMNLAIDFASQSVNATNLQNQMILTSLDTLSRNIESFNNNSMAFENINKKIIDYWASIIKKEKN